MLYFLICILSHSFLVCWFLDDFICFSILFVFGIVKRVVENYLSQLSLYDLVLKLEYNFPMIPEGITCQFHWIVNQNDVMFSVHC